jgi:hypothetical protein
MSEGTNQIYFVMITMIPVLCECIFNTFHSCIFSNKNPLQSQCPSLHGMTMPLLIEPGLNPHWFTRTTIYFLLLIVNGLDRPSPFPFAFPAT